jgi:hypothetical protein
MNWYYVDAGQQAGPVDDAQLEALSRSGKIQSDTLVWREGMANWQPYGQVKAASAPPAAGAPPGMGGGTQTAPEAVCAECGRMFPTHEMIRHNANYICAGCKPVFMQKLSEGIGTGSRRGSRTLPVDPDALLAEIKARDYEVDIASTISRGWAVYKANFGICLGATLLIMICNQVAGFVPIVGIIASLILQGPLLGGLYYFFIKLVRGESAGIGDAFSGFSAKFWRLCGSFLLMILVVYLFFIPAAAYFLVTSGSGNEFGPIFWILGALGAVGAVYFGVAFGFALPLCVDLGFGPLDSLRVSRRVVSMHWFSLFGLLVVTSLIVALGLLACCIGVIFTTPILYAAYMQAYEDIFGARP